MTKVLIAEDEATARKIMVKTVEKLGHVAINSPNGSHAWETIESNPDIGLLITDIRMPKLDGRDLIRRVRERTESAGMPIIIVSGVVGPKVIASFLEQGATWFVAKPIDARELQKYIEQSLQG